MSYLIEYYAGPLDGDRSNHAAEYIDVNYVVQIAKFDGQIEGAYIVVEVEGKIAVAKWKEQKDFYLVLE